MADTDGDTAGTLVVPGRPTISLARPARADPRRAVLELYDAHQRELHSFVRSLERDPAAVEDIVADAFLRLAHEIAAGRQPDEPQAWLHRVAANLVVNGGRHRNVVARALARLVDRGADEPADAPVLRAETRRELVEALRSLPVQARTALMLAAHGFSGREIAAALGKTEVATRSMMSRARVRLRERLGTGPREDVR
jgi:RNA polymerase sigma-70 factor (ECF subfamily)